MIIVTVYTFYTVFAYNLLYFSFLSVKETITMVFFCVCH